MHFKIPFKVKVQNWDIFLLVANISNIIIIIFFYFFFFGGGGVGGW